jgi:cell wall-associated NlpC family hydrolase
LPEPREKPRMEKPKTRNPSVLSPKQAARVLTSNYQRHIEQRVPGEENETEYATEQVESTARRTAKKLADGISRFPDRKRKVQANQKPRAGQDGQSPGNGSTEPAKAQEQPNASTERPVTEAGRQGSAEQVPTKSQRERNAQRQLRGRKDALKEKSNSRQQDGSEPSAIADPPGAQSVRSKDGLCSNQLAPKNTATAKRPSAAKGAWQATYSPPSVSPNEATPRERPRVTASTLKTRENVKTAAKASDRANFSEKKLRRSKSAAQALRRTRQNKQRQITQRMVKQTRKTAKSAAVLIKKAAVAVTKAVVKMYGSLVGMTGGALLLIVLVIVFVVAAIGNSPFGIFFAAERSAPNAVSVSEAVSTVNMAYNAKLEELQSGGYDSIQIEGQAADWPEVLAVFAACTAGAEDGVDVVTLDTDRVKRLTNIFWGMTAITTEVEAIDHRGNGEDDPGWTEHILHITITAKTADDMRTQYSFTKYQNNVLDELLSQRDALATLAGSLTITNEDVSNVLNALPKDLSTERQETVKTALSLVGKVNYFWGGKSSVIGWDSRWGTLQQVTAAGSPTTGTYRPYGLDCSGYIDWIFNNSLGYVIGHGGGVAMQHSYCKDISWDEAQPGDLAFYPDDSHVGIVVGRSDTGGILVAHCSSGHNNVVITDCAASGFTAIGRPDIFY